MLSDLANDIRGSKCGALRESEDRIERSFCSNVGGEMAQRCAQARGRARIVVGETFILRSASVFEFCGWSAISGDRIRGSPNPRPWDMPRILRRIRMSGDLQAHNVVQLYKAND